MTLSIGLQNGSIVRFSFA